MDEKAECEQAEVEFGVGHHEEAADGLPVVVPFELNRPQHILQRSALMRIRS